MENEQSIMCGAYVTITGHRCYRCGHEWRPLDFRPLDRSELPKSCPKCKNAYWDRPRKKVKNEQVNT